LTLAGKHPIPQLMNFTAQTKAWIMLLTLVLSSGTGAGVTAFLGGSHWLVATVIGVGVAATNVYHALSESPKDKAARSVTKAPFTT
jgi:hypothetical protein